MAVDPTKYADNHEQDMELQKIDILHLMREALKGLRALWFLPILLFLIFSGMKYLRTDRSYTPYYQTYGTVYVSMTDDTSKYQNQLSAEQMDKLFPYMMNNGLLTEAICEKLGCESIPGNISASVDGRTNLITFTSTGDDPEVIHDLLLATIEVYPRLIEFIVGPTTFMLFKDMGVPAEPANQPLDELHVIVQSVRYGAKFFLAGFVLACLYGMTIKSITNREDMKRYLNASYLGSLPRALMKKRTKKNTNSKNQLTVDNENCPYSFQESVRMLRGRLERNAEKSGDHVILVTSTVPGEGKTTVSVNLALALAQAGRKVLLVDGDMRNPSVAKCLQLSSEKGLSDVLKGNLEAKDAIINLSESDLFVLPAGNALRTGQSSDLLTSQAMEDFIKLVKDYADYVIIDTPPVLVLGDCIAVGKYIDSAVYVVRSGHARRSMILDGISQLGESSIKVLGTVLNDDHESASAYGYSYGKYGHYGSYGKKKYGNYGSY